MKKVLCGKKCKDCAWIDMTEYDLRLEIVRCYELHGIMQWNNILQFGQVNKDQIKCYYFKERTEENKNDFKLTSEYKSGCYF